MTSTSRSATEAPNIQEFISKNARLIEKDKFTDLLVKAERAQNVFNQFSSLRLSTIARSRVLEIMWNQLFDEIDRLNLEGGDADKTVFKEELRKIKKKFDDIMPRYIQADAHNIDLAKRLTHLKWHGDAVAFSSKEDLANIISQFCNELTKSGQRKISFTIYLPQPSDYEREESKSAPQARAHEHAKAVFLNAAKAGIFPKDVNLTIDNKSIAITHDDFKADVEQWNKIAASAIKERFEHTPGVAETLQPNPSALRP